MEYDSQEQIFNEPSWYIQEGNENQHNADFSKLFEYEYSKDSYQTHIQNLLPWDISSGVKVSTEWPAGNDPSTGEKTKEAWL